MMSFCTLTPQTMKHYASVPTILEETPGTTWPGSKEVSPILKLLRFAREIAQAMVSRSELFHVTCILVSDNVHV